MFWTDVLDDLERRVAAAESGDLAALEGWVEPVAVPAPVAGAELHRAAAILARQQAVIASLTERKAAVARAMSATRRSHKQYRAAAPLPVYVDRTA